MKSSYINLHPALKLAMTAFVALSSLLVVMIIGVVVAIPFSGTDIFSFLINNNAEYSADNIAFLKYLQIIQSIGLFIVPSVILAFLFGNNASKYLKVNVVPYPQGIILAISIIIIASPLINVIGEFNSKMVMPEFLSGVEKWMRESEDAAGEITKLFVNTTTISGLLVNILMIGIIPAIGEELLFRGVIQRIFTEWFKSYHWGIWISAILFSALHLQFYGFFPRLILGASFGYLLAWSGNLWFPIIAHFINNTIAVFAYYFYNKGIINFDPDKIGTNSEYQIVALISLILMIFLFWAFHKVDRNLRLKSQV